MCACVRRSLAKTLAIKTLASLIDAKYSRIQFTPDLLPADVIGTDVVTMSADGEVISENTVENVLEQGISEAVASVARCV